MITESPTPKPGTKFVNITDGREYAVLNDGRVKPFKTKKDVRRRRKAQKLARKKNRQKLIAGVGKIVNKYGR